MVRIATHPDATKMGYGTRALELLRQFYEGKATVFAEDEDDDGEGVTDVDQGLHRSSSSSSSKDEGGLTGEKVNPRKQLPPLLVPIADIRRPPRLHWLGTSFGLTLNLFNFWRRSGYSPVYLRQTANELTGEHTTIMLRPLDCSDLPPSAKAPTAGWADGFVTDFARRYMSLLGSAFRTYDATLALSVLDAATGALSNRGGAGGGADDDDGPSPSPAAAASNALVAAPNSSNSSRSASGGRPLSGGELRAFFTGHDLARLTSYARNLVDHHMVLDLLPDLTRLYFQVRLFSA